MNDKLNLKIVVYLEIYLQVGNMHNITNNKADHSDITYTNLIYILQSNSFEPDPAFSNIPNLC